jgi:hypothetical protein
LLPGLLVLLWSELSSCCFHDEEGVSRTTCVKMLRRP